MKGYNIHADKGRQIACRKAINCVKSLSYEIKSVNDIIDLPMIGKGMQECIVEILETGRLRKAETLTSQVKNDVIELFSQIWGLGVRNAAQLYLKGMRSLEDLRRHEHLLNKTQRSGLKHLEIQRLKVPREE